MEESQFPTIKQVIVMRHDLKMRRGKQIAQGAVAIHDKAFAMGLEVHLITDSGRTEFQGLPTRTCLAIGPEDATKINQVTGHLQLL